MALSLAEFIKQFLKDEDGARWAENNEGLTAKQAEYRSLLERCPKNSPSHPDRELNRERDKETRGEREDKKEDSYRWS